MNFNSKIVALKIFLGNGCSYTNNLAFAMLLAILRFVGFLNRKTALCTSHIYFYSSPSPVFSACLKQFNRWLICIWDIEDINVVLQSRTKRNV